MKNNLILGIFFAIALQAGEHRGLVIKPVADLFGQPPTLKHARNIPLAGTSSVCLRLHQLLFNETVEIVQETSCAYQVRISNLFYITQQNNKPQDTYWTLKENILPIDQIPDTCAQSTYIPRAPDYGTQETTPFPIITLQKPWRSDILGKTFSAGTRFVCAGTKKGYYQATVWHSKHQNVTQVSIPKSFCIITPRSQKKAVKIYNQLLRKWAGMQEYIPYVWGGCSFTYTLPQSAMCKKITDKDGTYYIIHEDTHEQKHGFDCAGLIARAAQIAGIPYYYKNTFTLAHYLKPLTDLKNLREGDLIWIPGHVMAVAHIKKNTIIEARHYSHGYGKVHEIALENVFKNIKTFADLFEAVHNKSVLERLDHDGKPVQKIHEIKLLSIQSCWN